MSTFERGRQLISKAVTNLSPSSSPQQGYVLPLHNRSPPFDDGPIGLPPPLIQESQIIQSPKITPASSNPGSVPGSPGSPVSSMTQTQNLRTRSRNIQGIKSLDKQKEFLVNRLNQLLKDQGDALDETTHDDSKDITSIRRSIFFVMQELISVQKSQEGIIESPLKDAAIRLKQLKNWERKKVALQAEITKIKSQDIDGQTAQLKIEADELDKEIIETEMKLNRLRQKHAQLSEQIATIENSAEAKLASYTGSLEILNKEIRDWLNHAPLTNHQNSSDHHDFYSLHKSRRTADGAYAYWTREYTTLEDKYNQTHFETRALEQGIQVWNNVTTHISKFEMVMSRVQENYSSDLMKQLIERWEEVIEFVDAQYQLAQSKNWNLLVQTIGAELVALKQGLKKGRTLLSPSTTQESSNNEPLSSQYESSHSHIVDSSSKIDSQDSGPKFQSTSRLSIEESEDDDSRPPDFLLGGRS